MEPNLRELLKVDSMDALNFFFENIKKLEPSKRLSKKEALYVSSVLASYAQTSREEQFGLPPFSDLSQVFDEFILIPPPYMDATLLEIAGSQCLLLAGFFRDQMDRRHNLPSYDRFGRSFYAKAGELTQNPIGKVVFPRVAKNFSDWTSTCHFLSRQLRERRYLLKLD